MARKIAEKPWQRRARILREHGACPMCARTADGTKISLRELKADAESDLGPAPDEASVAPDQPQAESKRSRSRKEKTATATA